MFRKKHTAPGARPGTLVISEDSPKPEIKVIDYGLEHFEELEIEDPAEITASLDKDSTTWIMVMGLGDEAVLRTLSELFDIHPLALADVVNVPQRPKHERYRNHEFVITRMAILDSGGNIRTEQVNIFIGSNYVLTFIDHYRDRLDPIKKRIREGRGPIRKAGASYLAYAILDLVLDYYYPLLEEFGNSLEKLEDEAASNPEPKIQRDIRRARINLNLLRRVIWPQRDLLNSLMRDESDLITEQVRFYMRDCYDHAIQLMDVVESYREQTGGLMDLYLSGISNRMNEVMKVLTIIATIFIPITFIAGIYGMNFEFMPELKWKWSYFLVWAIMTAIAGGMIIYFWRLGWITKTGKNDNE